MTYVINWKNSSILSVPSFRGVIAVFLMIALAGCTRSPQQEAMRIGALNGPGGLSLVKVMQDRVAGRDSAEHYMIRNDPALIKAMMSRGDLDLALVPLTTAALLYNSGVPYRLVAVPVWGSLFVVGEDTSICHLEDLRGKRLYMMAKSMTPDILMRHILLGHGIEPERDLNMDYTFPTPTELASAMQAGRVPLGIVSEPMMSLVLHRNSNLKVLFDLTKIWHELYPTGPPLAQTAIMARNDWTAKYPGKLLDWCARYAEGLRWIKQYPDSTGLLAVRHAVAPHAQAAASAVRRCRFDFQYASTKKAQIRAYLEVLYGNNPRIIGNKIPDEGFFYSK